MEGRETFVGIAFQISKPDGRKIEWRKDLYLVRDRNPITVRLGHF